MSKYRITQAFTLIELLIVVLIIAILAAIAVPNFLEFQTRAKVSRVHADMRTLAIGIEAYTVDEGRPPIDSNYGRNSSAFSPVLWTSNDRDTWQRQLTTPIAYISTFLDDPFVQNGIGLGASGGTLSSERGYIYRHFDDPDGSAVVREAIMARGYLWATKSLGPDFQADTPFIQDMLNDRDPNALYDPTNGTVSRGDIYRTNKGILVDPQL